MKIIVDLSTGDNEVGSLAWDEPNKDEWIRINSLGLKYIKSGVAHQSVFNIIGVDII